MAKGLYIIKIQKRYIKGNFLTIILKDKGNYIMNIQKCSKIALIIKI